MSKNCEKLREDELAIRLVGTGRVLDELDEAFQFDIIRVSASAGDDGHRFQSPHFSILSTLF